MKLEDQVVSLELAIKLKEIFVSQDGLFSWVEEEDGDFDVDENYIGVKKYQKIILHESMLNCQEFICSAFSASEIGELLPSSIESYGLEIYATSALLDNGKFGGNNLWHIRYADKGCELFERKCGIKECDARAEMLIYLIENKLIEVNNA